MKMLPNTELHTQGTLASDSCSSLCHSSSGMSSPGAVRDAAEAFAALAEERAVLTCRWQCLVEEQKQLMAMMQLRAEQGGKGNLGPNER